MTETRLCSTCGAPLAADAPGGVCPQCVLKLGLESGSVPVLLATDSGGEVSLPTPSAGRDPGPTTPGGGAFTPPSVEELQRHFPQMEIISLLGRGGMGAVYKARQPALDRLVALKILPPEVGRDPHFAERFTREARALAKLSHPNIVMVYEFGQSDGLYFLIMEYVDGVNLRQTIRGGALTSIEALKIVPQICEALQFAHEEGVVHRDIKPENILLDKRGRLKIADFGLAKLLGRTDSALLLTQTYQVMGTLHYMAPEQFERPTAVDHRADIYSLGVVFYELLTGQLPLGRFALPSEKVNTDTRLDDVVLKTLEREPERRYQHASDVKTDLESIAKNEYPEREPAAYTRITPRTPPTASATTVPAELSPLEWEAARRKVQAPAIGLMVVGALNLLPCLAGVLLPLVWLVLPRGAQRMIFGSLPQWPGFAEVATAAGCAIAGLPMVPVLMAQQAAPQASRSTFALGPMELISLPFLLFSIPFGVLMILGGYKLRRLELYGLCVLAAVAAMLPCTPGFVIGLPIGVWALLVLWNPDVKAAFGHKPILADVVAEPAKAHSDLLKKPPPLPDLPPLPGESASAGGTAGPGTALVVTGLLSVLFWLIMFGISFGFQLQHLLETKNSEDNYTAFDPAPFISPWGLLIASLIVYGGFKLRSQTSYRWSMAASGLALLPASPVCLLGFWVGLWSFFTLQSSSVKRSFEAVRRRSSPKSFGSALPGLSLVLAPAALSIVLSLGLFLAGRAVQPEPVGTVLVYDIIVPRSDGTSATADVLAFCDARINVGNKKIAQIKQAVNPRFYEGGLTRVEIGVYGDDPLVANRIEERLQAQGKIEFAILADSEVDAAIIARAKGPAVAEVPPDNVNAENPGAPIPPVARWVALRPKTEQNLKDPFGGYREFATRRTAEGSLEILVLVDPLNLTEKELSFARVEPSRDPTRAALSLAFNSEGAKKMRTLTNRPENVATAFKRRRMGIVIDGALASAPMLESPLADQLQITGDFSLTEANELVSLVQAGPPPGTIKQVSRKALSK